MREALSDCVGIGDWWCYDVGRDGAEGEECSAEKEARRGEVVFGQVRECLPCGVEGHAPSRKAKSDGNDVVEGVKPVISPLQPTREATAKHG